MISWRTVRVNSHSGSESTSTRSPRLKTRPCPANRLSMIRKLMKASSSTHRYDQAPTRTMTTGTTTGHHRTTAAQALARRRPSGRPPVRPRRRSSRSTASPRQQRLAARVIGGRRGHRRERIDLAGDLGSVTEPDGDSPHRRMAGAALATTAHMATIHQPVKAGKSVTRSTVPTSHTRTVGGAGDVAPLTARSPRPARPTPTSRWPLRSCAAP